jgi:hypothetical protein
VETGQARHFHLQEKPKNQRDQTLKLGIQKHDKTRSLLMKSFLQPFNAFLSGFSATVGQFVLTASLRIQTNPANKGDFENISHER